MTFLVDVRITRHQYDHLVALQDCHLRINNNSFCAIVGPNGAGKSTFLKIVSGLFPPTQGAVVYHNISASQIAYLAQNSGLDRTFPLRVEDVVAMGLWSSSGIFRQVLAVDRDKIHSVLKTVGLEGFEKRSLMALSGGQLQRLLFARAITQDAQLILLDEPFCGIDQPTIQDLVELMRGWIAQGKTVLTVLHDIAMVRQYFPETILIARELIAHGATEDVLTQTHLTKAIFNV